MSFSRLSVLLRLPLAVLICSQLVYLGSDLSSDDHWVSSGEVMVVFEEREVSESSDTGLPAVAAVDFSTQRFDWAMLGLGNVSESAVLDLRATSPPSA
jgi:hypothetical protein